LAVLEISVVPLGTHDTSLSGKLAGIPKVLRDSGLRYEIHPMGSVVEGPTEELFSLAARLHQAVFERGASLVAIHFVLDDRRDVVRPMEEKVRSLMASSEEAGP
jgi:uncharacterized protein (TIGR00106 family)